MLPEKKISILLVVFLCALGLIHPYSQKSFLRAHYNDAIVAGENIYEYRSQGIGFAKAAILGARDVALPIGFSILTNIVAFLPLCFVPGYMGKIFRVIPFVVISVFAISWVESLFILPAHLAHSRAKHGKGMGGFFHRGQQAFRRGFTRFVEAIYGPFLKFCIRVRYVTVAVGVMILVLILGYGVDRRTEPSKY